MQKKHLIGAIAGIFLAGIQAWAQYDITLAPGSVSSQYADSPPSEDASKLFDHNELTKYFTFHSTSWITFKANNQYVVSSYTLISGNDYPERDPSSWKLEGSNDGSSWSSIDSRSGQSFSGRLQKKAFASSNTTAYQYYKLSISTSFTEIQLADLTLFAQLDHDVAVTNISLSSKSLQTSSIPTVLISNNGLSTENFKVTCVIDSSGKQVYNKTADVKDLAKSQSAKISLPSFPFLCSTYKIHAFTTLSTDSTPYNDTLEYHLSTTGYNLATDKVVYEVAGVHLDDMWLWTYDDVIREYLPNTLTENFKLLNTYPEYEFSWEGAFRYNMIKQHFPARYDTLKSWIAKDRWHYVGTFWDACDVNMPSAEALIRQSLYGTEFSMDEFGKRSFDIYLPDCFGFGYVLPTIARHCGIIGFSTQKFDRWGGYFPSPFSVGRWIGPDGSEIIAALKPGDYFGTGMDIRTADGDETKAKSGVWLTYDYIGMGDRGGSPREEDVSAMCGRIKQNSSNDIKVVCKASDQLYRDLSPAQFAALPSYEGELLMKMHGVGCYTSWASMKLKNRKNEQLAMAAEFSNVSAHWLSGGSFTYPMDNISNAWKRFLACQFHDVLTGTSNTNVYDIAQSMEDSSVADFTNAFLSGNNAVAANTKQPLTTTVSKAGRIPVVVANPLAFDRVDIAEVSVTPFTGSGVKVFDTKGNEVASQIIGTTGNAATIAFVAHAPSAGYAVYEVEQSDKANDVAGSLSIKSGGGIDTLENGFYRVVVNKNGDIASVYHKASSKELLAAPSRLEMRPDPSVQEYPAWEITCDAVSASPTAYVDESVQKTIVEQGPARVCLKVVHSKNGSTFTHYIRLGADSAGMRVDVANEVDWRTTGTLLKVGFPMTCANDKATWDLGIGTIMRGVMTSDLYEVPGQQWADQTASDGSYGMSILNDCKYGWNKESNAKLNLTLIHFSILSFHYNNNTKFTANVCINELFF